MRKFVLACAAFALLVAVPAVAQETRGSIEGVVKDTTGGVLPGVTVEATLAGGAPLTTVTDAKGVYRFPAVAPGKYVVKSTLSGFTPAKLENVNVGLGVILTVDLTMAPGGMTEPPRLGQGEQEAHDGMRGGRAEVGGVAPQLLTRVGQ